MASNSKISAHAKSELKWFKKSMPKNVAFATSGSLTVLVRVMSNCVMVSTALASPDEKKIRRKVGEFHAMERMSVGKYVVFGNSWGECAQKVAQYYADNLS